MPVLVLADPKPPWEPVCNASGSGLHTVSLQQGRLQSSCFVWEHETLPVEQSHAIPEQGVPVVEALRAVRCSSGSLPPTLL